MQWIYFLILLALLVFVALYADVAIFNTFVSNTGKIGQFEPPNFRALPNQYEHTTRKWAMNDCKVREGNNTSGVLPSVLATITGGWAFKESRTDERLMYLHIILTNYVSVCEAGFDVSVILISYDTGFSDWKRYFDFSKYWCYRIMRPIFISAEFFEFRKLPKSAFGTKGDLSIRHREIFLRHLDKHDIFLVQEDDVSLDSRSLLYFVYLYCFLVGAESSVGRAHKLNPAFFDTESNDGYLYISWRMRKGVFFRLNDKILFKSGYSDNTGGRSYILTRSELLKLVNNWSSWIDPSKIKGEFNPAVSSPAWFSEKRELVTIVNDDIWIDGKVPHFPNKYIRLKLNESIGSNDRMFESLKIQEQMYIFQACEYNFPSNKSDFPNVSITGDECEPCFDKGGQISFDSVVYTSREHGIRFVDANFKCTL